MRSLTNPSNNKQLLLPIIERHEMLSIIPISGLKLVKNISEMAMQTLLEMDHFFPCSSLHYTAVKQNGKYKYKKLETSRVINFGTITVHTIS